MKRAILNALLHLTKVHDYARTIPLLEGLDDKTLATLEAAALVHDIGIRCPWKSMEAAEIYRKRKDLHLREIS